MKKLNTEKLLQNIDSIAEYDLMNKKILGSAYCVCYNGKKIERFYGASNLSLGKPVTDRSIFRLASMTKPITAAATLILVEKGLVSLDDTIDLFLPEFKDVKIKDVHGNVTNPQNLPTIRNILTHSSGLAGDGKITQFTVNDSLSLDANIEYCLRMGLDFEPGTMQAYSGFTAFDVLAKIIEKITQTDFFSFLKKELFDVCGMYDTAFVPNEEQLSRMVDMHDKLEGNSIAFQMPAGCIFESFPWTHYLGGAGLVSSLHDYCCFASMLLAKGKIGDCRVLKEETVNMLCTPQISSKIMAGSERWGLGVRVICEATEPNLPKGAFGWSGAYGTHFWVDPVNNLYAVFMKNSKVDGGSGNESARNFEKAVYSSFEDYE